MVGILSWIIVLITVVLTVGHFINFDIRNVKLYRKYKGGTWYRYFPRMFPYMIFYTNNIKDIKSHEIIDRTEHY